MLAGLDGAGIEILEEAKDFEKKLEETEELLDLELPVALGGEKINDPVRMYLREMGTVPLLTREGEVEIARRIERGQNTVLKSLSRAPLVIQEIFLLGEEMAKDLVSARDVVQISDPILTDELVEEKRQEFFRSVEDLARHYKKFLQMPAEAAGHSAQHEAQAVPAPVVGTGPAGGADHRGWCGPCNSRRR